ncbi:MAG: polysaccharide biosynthesis C-terminal domain-containing protein, partial [Proteobacteria bacterium]|nr:polysaccharide biosynthesis C-terminal domain-containing protein [Pseudomonadota bacterium]
IKVLAPGYFARQDTKTPVKIGIIAMVTNMVLNIILMLQFAHVGLALATSISAGLNAALLFVGLRKLGVYQPDVGWRKFFFQLVVANVSLLLVLLWLTPPSTAWLNWDVWQRFSHLLGLISAAAVIYFAVLALVGIKLTSLLKLKAE